MSPIGVDFPRERFLRTPIGAIVKVLKHIDSEEQRTTNLQSSAVAVLGVQLAYIAWGFSGSKSGKPKVKLQDFLPFPDWRPPGAKVQEGPSEETRAVLTQLLRTRQIPMHVFTQLVTATESTT